MQTTAKPKGLAKIWREVQRPFRKRNKGAIIVPNKDIVAEKSPRQVTTIQYRSYSDLSQDIRNTLYKIPRDIDLVIGIPKSGMIPAMMIGLGLNISTSDLGSFLEGRLFSHGFYRSHDGQKKHLSDCKKILVVDDSIKTGRSMEDVQKRISESPIFGTNLQTFYMAAYCTPASRDKVDIYCKEIASPRIFEWNVMHSWILKKSCVDIDGVLCPDPTEMQNDDGEQYIRFIEEAPPMYLPEYPIHTLVTNRLEKYRDSTEKWLSKHGVVYERLAMLDLPTKRARITSGANYGEHKANVFLQSDCILFIESSHRQAQGIVRLSGKPVLSVEKQVILNPGDV